MSQLFRCVAVERLKQGKDLSEPLGAARLPLFRVDVDEVGDHARQDLVAGRGREERFLKSHAALAHDLNAIGPR